MTRPYSPGKKDWLVLETIVSLGSPWAYDICRYTQLSAGTVYLSADRLLKAGWITADWKDAGSCNAGGGPHQHRYYSPVYSPAWYAARGREQRARRRERLEWWRNLISR